MPTNSHRNHPIRARWRWVTPAVFAVAGLLLVASARSSDGTDLRPGRNDDLASLVRSEAAQQQEVEDRAAEMTRNVDRLSGLVNDSTVKEARAQANLLEGPAGFHEVSGAGLTVVLSDAPEEVREESDENINLLIVHQQDIQAVVNAMWKAGAEAITIQGQRLISTTGIKCAGNSVELQGIPYPQPFVIQAVGDPAALQAGIDSDAYLDFYRTQSVDPDIAIGWEMATTDSVRAPAYSGLRTLQHAVPLSDT